MTHIHEKYEYRGCTIKIVADEGPGNPFKEWDGMPTVVHWHRNYDLGDTYDGPHPFEEPFEAIQYLRDKYGCTVVLPL